MGVALALAGCTTGGLHPTSSLSGNEVLPLVHGPVAQNRPSAGRAGKAQVGEASVYAQNFSGRRMANGERFDPGSSAAASKSLPIGTVAKITNLRTGQSTQVEVKDRGPFVPGRIVDLAPQAASRIGIDREQGVAPVRVTPLLPPRSYGRAPPAGGAPNQDVAAASSTGSGR